mgnify:FL=1|tara:strand:- start:659 stop:1048 length:390 start_codon:yes stop_codon:yes gene_type:complete
MKRAALLTLFLLVSCNSSEEMKSMAPDFGFHVDRIANVAEGQIIIGTFTATVTDGSIISYTTSNTDMTISSDGVLSFLIEPDYETQNEHLTEVIASNDSGSDTINVKVKVIDTLCEFDTAAVFDNCFFE